MGRGILGVWRNGKPGFVAAIEDPNISALVELGQLALRTVELD